MKRKRERHGMCGTPVYGVWESMMTRCHNPNRAAYADYGGRGIAVCEAWQMFSGFYADMGDPPVGMMLDRIDNDGSYVPENCRWVSRKEQNRNRRGRRLITARGVTRPLYEWSEITGVAIGTLSNRLRLGWSEENVVNKPKRPTTPQDKPDE